MITLKFKTVLDLMDFTSVIAANGHEVDPTLLTIRGEFEDADIELAKAGYMAALVFHESN